MPDSHTSNRLCTIAQQGSSVAGATWNDGNRILGFPAGFLPIVQGVRFQLRASATEEPTRIRRMALILRLLGVAGVPATLGAAYVVMQNTPYTEPFSLANPPLYDLGPFGAANTAGWTYIVNDATPDWNPGVVTPASINCPVGTASTDPIVGTTYYDLTAFANQFENYSSDGILNMSVQVTTGAQYATFDPLLLVTELDFFTGVAGSKGREKADSRVRIVRDSRFGMPSWSEDLVEDEYTPGLWVRANDKDPEDEYREYVPNPREGTRDDDVPLE